MWPTVEGEVTSVSGSVIEVWLKSGVFHHSDHQISGFLHKHGHHKADRFPQGWGFTHRLVIVRC